jgi:hypothetical protein
MVVMQGNGGAGKITIGVCVMEKKVRILALWFVVHGIREHMGAMWFLSSLPLS